MKNKVVFVLCALVAAALISCADLERERRAAQIIEMPANAVKACQFLGNIRGCTKDDGRSIEVGLQEQASNHLELQR